MGGRFRIGDIDWFLLGLALAIAVIGVVEIYSTTLHSPLAGQYKKQVYWLVLSCILALIVGRIDYHMILEQTPWLYGVSLLLLAGLLVAGRSIAGTRRWLQFGSMSFQVSEIVKLIIILVVAAYFANRRMAAVAWGDLVKLGIVAGIPAALVALEPDLGTALTFIPIIAAGIIFAGIRWQHVAVLCLVGILALPVGWHFLRPYQRERLMTFVHPTQNTQSSSYQVTQTKIAIGSGGFWGRGLGNGTQSRLGFIPVSHADSIFAAFAEEQGFVGTLLVLLVVFCSAFAFARWSADGSRPRGGLPSNRIGRGTVLSSGSQYRDDDWGSPHHRRPFAAHESGRLLVALHVSRPGAGDEREVQAICELNVSPSPAGSGPGCPPSGLQPERFAGKFQPRVASRMAQ